MKRKLLFLACLVALIGSLAPPAFAQAPAPKVTINGLFDQITSTGRNIYDGDFTRSNEDEWYARTRFRPDFTFEVGRTKAVLGLEVDLQYGACGLTGADGAVGTAGAAGCKTDGGGLDLNTDVRGTLEVKWIYTEFDLTGPGSLLPFIPVNTVARAGGQPFGSLANYKTAYATGDFGGLALTTTWTPMIKSNFVYVQVEEETANVKRPAQISRGEDWAIIATLDITPIKGLDIKPLYSYFRADGTTNASARRTVLDGSLAGGATNAAGSFGPMPNSMHEDRHTIGFDARWRWGAFGLDPTFYYQLGSRDYINASGRKTETGIDAFLLDLIGSWQFGPLLLEARYIYSSGNDARDVIADEINYYEPLNQDTSYYAGWASILALGVDYFNGGGGANAGMSTNIGYDRYGRHQFGLRATYAITPALSIYGVVSPTWTAEEVDTDTFALGGNRSAPVSSGDDSYIGTEVNLGLTWRFAPNTVFDLSGAYLFAGSALDACRVTGAAGATCGGVAGASKVDAEDGWTIAARVRMSF